jgi:DNA invertase Pin-like site-specific DNA recombinase
MLIGYARTSTVDQVAGLEAQLSELAKLNVEKIFTEQISAVVERKALAEALDFCREGDVFIVTKLDRLARSVMHLSQLVDRLERKKVTLRILNLNLDTASPTGKLMVNLLGAIAAFERDIMLERQRDGIAAAKVKGKYKGRAPTAKRKSREVIQLIREGHSVALVARKLSISRASVYRIWAESRAHERPLPLKTHDS